MDALNLEYRFQQIIILTVLFILIDIAIAWANGNLFSVIGVGLVFYNFIWAVAIEIIFATIGFIIKVIF